MRRASVLLLACLALAGCDLSMRRQARYDAQSTARLWSDGLSSRQPPDGVAETDALAKDAADKPPAMVDLAFVRRGQERFAIFCAPCHGASGAGDGRAVQRGFPHPPSFDDPRQLRLSGAEIHDAITRGYGVMYPFADRIAPADRWALVAYVRALQTAADQPASAVPPGVIPLEPGP